MPETYREDDLAREDRQVVIFRLITRHGWSLLPEGELVERILSALPPEILPSDLERLIVRQYFALLYDACLQPEPIDLRERAYGDLAHYLYRIAYNKWRDVAEEAMQRTLLLIYEKQDQCRGRMTFNGFVISKFRQATTEILRAKRNDASVEELEERGIPDDRLPLDAVLTADDCLKALLESLGRLRDQQRQTIVLKFFQGLADEEISARLQITTNLVRVTRHRSLQQLREDRRLRESCGEVEFPL